MANLNTMVKETEKKATHAADRATTKGKELVGRVGERMSEAWNDPAVEKAVDVVKEKRDQAIAWAKENPLLAAAIGTGVGFLFGVAVRRALRPRS